MEEALAFLNNLHPVSKELREYLLHVLKQQSYAKGSYLLRAGQVCRHAFYLQSGIVRWYHHDGDREMTTWFTMPGKAILVARSFYNQLPGYINLQAITDCETIYIGYHELMEVYDLFPETRIMGLKISDYDNEQKSRYINAMKMHHPEDRYKYLQQQFPALLYAVDAAYLASFINVDESTLYKIRKRQQGKDGEV